jgi:hypothetical protein
MFRTVIPALLALVAFAALGAQQPADDMAHMHHMATRKAAGVHLKVATDAAQHVITLRFGPVNLPAHAGMNVPQPPMASWTASANVWFTAYHPRLTDASGHALPGRLLHHVAVFDQGNRNYLCPSQPEHIFGAGGEMTNWPAMPGLGYRVRKGDRISVRAMFHNDEPVSYPQTYLEIKVQYQPVEPGGPQLMGVRPVWFDVMGCGESAYDLKPGPNVTAHNFTLPTNGRLIGVGGHLHDYGRELVLRDLTRHQKIATLDAKLDPDGRLMSIPIAVFADTGGLELSKGDDVRVTAVYDNPTGHLLREGAMGIAVGYLIPEGADESAAR